jgi:hypothetical protein
MKTTILVVAVIVGCGALVAAQESKPVPKDSARVTIPGCSKGLIFTAGRRTSDEPGSGDIPEGMHLRMNGPKKLMAEIKAHEGSMIQLVGLMKKGQTRPGGVAIGGGVTIGPGPAGGGGPLGDPTSGQAQIDVEGWRSIAGSCPSR